MIQEPHILKNNIDHLNKQGPPAFFRFDTNPVLSNLLVHSVDKTHVLVVTVRFIWLLLLNILSSNFVQMPNKSLWFKKFRRSYVHCPVVAQTNHCQVFTASFFFFLIDARCSKWSHSLFCGCLSLTIVYLRKLFLLSIPIAQILLAPRWESRRKDVK